MTKKPTHSNGSKPRLIVPEVSDGTAEGLYSDAKALTKAGFGSILVKIAELGLFLKGYTNHRGNFLATLYDAYDGRIVAKSIKGEGREPNLENIPINSIMYSDYTLFKTEIKEFFKILMQTGLARRVALSFKSPTKLIAELKDDKETRELYDKAKNLGEDLFEIFKELTNGTCYKLEPEAKLIHNQYYKDLIDKSNDEENEMIKAEILSRHYKSIKLACLFACLNHPKELIINENDIEQAIHIVEYLSSDFRKFLKFRPNSSDIYDNIFDFFKANLKKEFKKTELINEYRSEIGLSRDYFRNNFEEIISILKEIAEMNDYLLLVDGSKYKNGNTYTMVKAEERQLSASVKNLEQLLPSDDKN